MKRVAYRAEKVRLRNIFALLGLIGLVIIILSNRHQFETVWHLLKSLRWYILCAAVVVKLANFWVNALYYRSILKIFSYDVGTVRLFEGALATNFVNYIVPSAGFAGAGFLSQVLSPEVPRGVSVLTQLMRYALSALGVLVTMPVGFLLIFLSNDSGHAIVKVTLISALTITFFSFCVLGFVQQESKLRRAVSWLMNKLRRVFPKIKTEAIKEFVDEFYVGYHTMVKQKIRMLIPFGWSIIYIIIEVGTFYLAFLAFGKEVNVGIAGMAYLFANIASIFGGVFFSTGIFEVGMAGTLVALGTPFALAVSVTAVYRVLNLIIGLPPGFYYYRKYLP